MTWIDLLEPSPREQSVPYVQSTWPDGEISKLAVYPHSSGGTFWDALDRRRSIRNFRGIDSTELAKFLWSTARVQETLGSSLGFEQTRRPVASAGAIHPIHTLLKRPDSSVWLRYEPVMHALISLPPLSVHLDDLEEKVARFVGAEGATTLLYIAEPGMTAAKYENEGSLIWRDAGALLGHSALVAAALGLAFCPLGLTGQEWVSRLNKQGQLMGVGVALLGALP